jgi:7,8-dihydroneopterin aldolase/epimerase/oxygenase
VAVRARPAAAGLTDWIRLTGLHTECVIGVLPEEREIPQPLEIEVRLGLDLGSAGDSGDLARTVSYDAVADAVEWLALSGRWGLLESLAVAAARLLLAPPAPAEARAQIDRVRIDLRKPQALGGQVVPEVSLEREASWCRLHVRAVATGVAAEVLCETPTRAAYRIHLAPEASWRPPDDAEVHFLPGFPAQPDPQVLSNPGPGTATVLLACEALEGT